MAQRLLRALPATTKLSVRRYNFAANNYAGCFGNLERINSPKLRKASVVALKNFSVQGWYSDPIVTVLKGERLTEGTDVKTTDAFGNENGAQIQNNSAVVDRVMNHMRDYKPGKHDLRKEIRALEQVLLHSDLAAQLVVNQAVDFKKQDGITEMEESAEANTVERRLNDLLLADEAEGVVAINRAPALISCVSNFSNFLDLFRKTIRNLEAGVPCVVLSRGNTVQHTFRWFQMLNQLLKDHGVDAGMLTFVSCDVTQQRRIISANPDSALYFTGSRPISDAIKQICPKLMASTGGPNTMVTTTWNPKIAQAVSWSASIENSGQCTALRHLVAPVGAANIKQVLGLVPKVAAPVDSLETGGFAAVFNGQKLADTNGYTIDASVPAAYKISAQLPGDDLNEMWRQVYIDVTETDFSEPNFSDSLAKWLVHHQPISLAINGETRQQAFSLANTLFEKTGMVTTAFFCTTH